MAVGGTYSRATYKPGLRRFEDGSAAMDLGQGVVADVNGNGAMSLWVEGECVLWVPPRSSPEGVLAAGLAIVARRERVRGLVGPEPSIG